MVRLNQKSWFVIQKVLGANIHETEGLLERNIAYLTKGHLVTGPRPSGREPDGFRHSFAEQNIHEGYNKVFACHTQKELYQWKKEKTRVYCAKECIVHMYMFVRSYICTHVCRCIHLYIHTYIQTYIHAYIHASILCVCIASAKAAAGGIWDGLASAG